MNPFITSRRYAESPEMVFAAIQDPVRLARWWGPDGFTNRVSQCDFTPGGRWVFDMVGPDGAVYPNECVFTTIEPGRRVVIDHVVQPIFTLTITLSPRDKGTYLHWQQAFADDAVAQAVRAVVEPANEQNLNRLAAELAPAA
jgi:uncharacterized protein YndB with AHSA1/START domain